MYGLCATTICMHSFHSAIYSFHSTFWKQRHSRGCTKPGTNSRHKHERKEPVQVTHLFFFVKLPLFFFLAAQLKTSAHWRVVQSPSRHLSDFCSSWQSCLRSSGLGWFVPFFFFFFWLKAFFLNDSVSIKMQKLSKN